MCTADVDVYIQSGDIVKGGRQDRTIAMDFVVPPKSGVIPISAFLCRAWPMESAAREKRLPPLTAP